jgi:hypothetical protein
LVQAEKLFFFLLLFISNIHHGRNDVVGGGVGKHGNHITASSSGQQWPAAASLVEKVLK